MSISIKEIAKLADVSVATVSRALNNNPRISEKTKVRIKEIAERFGYERNVLARGLKMKETNVLGLIVPSIVNPFFAELTQCVGNCAGQRGYDVMLCITNHKFEKERRYASLLKTRRVDGLIILIGQNPMSKAVVEIRELRREGLPFVVIGALEEVEADYITSDDVKAACGLTKHLIRLGHKRIAFISGLPDAITSQNRLKGYRQALEEGGIAYDSSLVVIGGATKNSGYESAKMVLAMRERPVAVIAVNDFVALGVLEALKEVGLRVPKDMAVVGFDDIKFDISLEVPLTTVRNPIDKIGEMAVKTVVRRIREKPKQYTHIVLEAELVIRESCGAKLANLRK